MLYVLASLLVTDGLDLPFQCAIEVHASLAQVRSGATTHVIASSLLSGCNPSYTDRLPWYSIGPQQAVPAYYLDIYMEDERCAAGKKTGSGTYLHVPNPNESIRLKFSNSALL
jgi:hypothetical protein